MSVTYTPFHVLPENIVEEPVSDMDTDMINTRNLQNVLVGTEGSFHLNETLKDVDSDQVLLTIFTTFKSSADRFKIHSNVLLNWAQFRPQVQPVLFAFQTDEKLVDQAKDLGWIVLPVARLNPTKVPFLRDMYSKAKEAVNSIFYGYSNGDLLFDNGIIDTLNIVNMYLPQLHQTLVVGERFNFPIQNKLLYTPSDVLNVRKSGKAKVFRVDAEDYFFIAHNTFPWDKCKDVVIGRPAYDNYLVGFAIINKVSVVDATKTLFALHQTGKDGDYAGHKNKDKGFNFVQIGKFNFATGHTTSAQYMTKYNTTNIELWKRKTKKEIEHHLVLQMRTTWSPLEMETSTTTTTTVSTTKTTTVLTTTTMPTTTKIGISVTAVPRIPLPDQNNTVTKNETNIKTGLKFIPN